MKRGVWKRQMKVDEISYLPSLILNNTPITRLDKEYVSRSSTTSNTGQLNDVFWNEAWSKRKSIIFHSESRKN